MWEWAHMLKAGWELSELLLLLVYYYGNKNFDVGTHTYHLEPWLYQFAPKPSKP